MHKKIEKLVSLLLAVVMALALVPSSVIAAAADAAYEVLVEPSDIPNIRDFQNGTYGNYAVVWDEVYFDPYTGEEIGPGDENRTHPSYIVEYTGSGVQQITDWHSYIGSFSSSGFAVARKSWSDGYGVINYKGELVFDTIYDSIREISDDGYAFANSNGKWVLLDLNTRQEIRREWFDDVDLDYPYNNGFVRVRSGDWGEWTYEYMDLNGNVVLGPYYNGDDFYNGYAFVREQEGDNGEIIDTNGNVVLSDEGKDYDIYELIGDSLVRVSTDTGQGIIDLSGNIVIPCEYRSISDIHNGYFVVYDNDYNYGVIDLNNSPVIPFGIYDEFSNVSNTNLVWAINYPSVITVLRVSEVSASGRYIYDTTDPSETMTFPSLERVTDQQSAINAVIDLTNTMTGEQKEFPTCIDLATLFAEEAVAKAASKAVEGDEIIINAAAVAELEGIARTTSAAVEAVLIQGGVSPARYVANTVTLTTEEMGAITIRVDPDVLTTNVDKIRVEAPGYALTLKVADFEQDLSSILTITAYGVRANSAARGPHDISELDVGIGGGQTNGSVTVSMPSAAGDTAYQAVVNENGNATSSKYNPVTENVDGKVNTSGTYTVKVNEQDFTDIANKSAEMQKAIRTLASKGIINGTGGTSFSPDASISRAEIAALVLRTLNKLDNNATNTFTDVPKSTWFYGAAGSSQRHGIINGMEGNTFQGNATILKEQIVAIASRVLKNDMGYKEPANPATYLAKYNDTIASWAQNEVALATKENLVVYRTDSTFAGSKEMTRGDAAIVIYRLFQRIW